MAKVKEIGKVREKPEGMRRERRKGKTQVKEGKCLEEQMERREGRRRGA